MVSTNEAHKTALSVSLIQERRHCCDTPLWLLPAGKLNVARNLRVRFGCQGSIASSFVIVSDKQKTKESPCLIYIAQPLWDKAVM